MTEKKTLDPRLTDFSFERRRAGYVEKMIDTHIHYNGDPKDLAMLVEASKVSRIETMFMIEWDSPEPGKWLREVDDAFGIGKGAIPFCKIDLQSNDPAQIDRAHDLGFWGLKWIGNFIAYDDHFFDPLLARAQELGMPLLVHTGVLSGGKGGAGMSVMRADMLDTVAKRYPQLLIQGAHLGCPHMDDAIWGSEFCDNLIWDCCGGCRFHCDANPYVLHSAMHRRSKAWKSITFATDSSQGMYPPEWADGWPSRIDHRMAEWQKILASLPVPPTTEQLDDFFYGNARRWIERIRAKRKK
jgi:predicted TIM-barrel fold metal-dependent hydrolase